MERILLLIKGLGRGGAEQLLVSSVPHLDRDQFSYEVAYLLPWKHALVGELTSRGIPVHCLHAERGPGWVLRLRSLVRERDFRLVHAHSPVPAIGVRLGELRRPGPRIVYTEHNVWERYHPVTYWGNALSFSRNDHVFAVSKQVRASIHYPALLRFLPMPPTEVRYYGIDPTAGSIASAMGGGDVRSELGIPADAPVVGTVANFKPGKGHGYLVSAAAKVLNEMPDARFVVVGTGPLESAVKKGARELGVDSSFIFTGYREDARRVMAAFDVLAVPSVYDGLSIALLEAMSLGKPAVLTRAGGNPEVVRDGEHGVVVPAADPIALAEGIASVLRDEARRARLGEAARRRAAEFDIRSAVRRTEQVYGQLLQASEEGRSRPARAVGVDPLDSAGRGAADETHRQHRR